MLTRYFVNKAADERGVARSTAQLIAELCSTKDDFVAMLDEFGNGYGFAIID